MDQAAVEQHRLSLISRGLLEYRETREDAAPREVHRLLVHARDAKRASAAGKD
jgi:hypothetical protein